MKYHTKPVVIEALQFNGKNTQECSRLLGPKHAFVDAARNRLVLLTPRGVLRVDQGHWVVKTSEDSVSTHTNEEFERLYEPLAPKAEPKPAAPVETKSNG